MSDLISSIAAAVRRAGKARALESDSVLQALLAALDEDYPNEQVISTAHFDRLVAVFDLTEAEGSILLVAAAAAIDPRMALAYGRLLGRADPSVATVALTLELAGLSVVDGRSRVLLGPQSPLGRWELVRIGDGPLALERRVHVPDEVIGAILGHQIPDPISAAMSIETVSQLNLPDCPATVELTFALAGNTALCWVEEPVGTAGLPIALAACRRSEISCTVLDFAELPNGVELISAARAGVRTAALRASAAVFASAELLLASPSSEVIALLSRSPVPVILVGRGRWNPKWRARLPIVVRATPMTVAGRLELWTEHFGPTSADLGLLAPFRLDADQIAAAAAHARRNASLHGSAVSVPMVTDAVRLLGGSGRLGGAGPSGTTSFADLQVPDETLAALKRLGSWVRLRDDVVGRNSVHGVDGKGSGIAALFTGAPGTGKTLAAHVIADTSGLDLMQVDLSGVIDKYIGETEKNLEKVFTDAENLNVILFFDEADALFGSRSEVKDAKDRYANQEVSYLLQRMEQFNGVTVLATNLRGNLDPAFSRRLHFMIHFPDPDVPTRQRLLMSLLSRVAEIDPEDSIDNAYLAATLELTGGDLRNIVMAAAYDAAAENTGVGQRHLLTAAVREYNKLGRRIPAGLLSTR